MKPYRPNVCAVPTDEARARVLVFRRVDRREDPHCWQFPQGGLQEGEDPRAGMLRELREETGATGAEVLARLPHPIRYDFPAEVVDWLSRERPELSHYQGQEQVWFLVRLPDGTASLHFDHRPAEFDAFQWVTPAEAVELVVPFKREAYRLGLAGLGLLPGPAAE